MSAAVPPASLPPSDRRTAPDLLRHLSAEAYPGEQVLIINRSAAGKRAMFTVVEPKTIRKLFQRLEVIEETFAETDGPI